MAVSGTAALLARTFRRMTTWRAVYAAGLVRNGVCVALAGPSGCGKTTLALELLSRAWSSFGDEYLLLDPKTLHAEPFPLGFALREPSLRILRSPTLERACRDADLATEDGGVRTWHGVDVADLFGPAALAQPRRLTHLVLMRTARATSLEPMSPSAAALELLPHVFIERLSEAVMWETIDSIVRLACYRLDLGDVREAANAVDDLAGVAS